MRYGGDPGVGDPGGDPGVGGVDPGGAGEAGPGGVGGVGGVDPGGAGEAGPGGVGGVVEAGASAGAARPESSPAASSWCKSKLRLRFPLEASDIS